MPEIKRLNSWKPVTTQEKLALLLIKFLKEKGYKETYIVGGYVRDMLLRKKETGAIDIATQASPQQVTKIFQKKGYNVIPTGIKHGTVTVHKGTDDIEFTTFRTEGKYADFRRPKNVKFINDPAKDAARRDFTVNAMYFDPVTKKIMDFYNGKADLRQGRLRFVGSPEKRIKEDALRLMRAIRFSSIMGLAITSRDLKIIKKHARLLSKISPERIKQELDKIILSKNRSKGLELLRKTGLLKQIAPELEKLNSTPQSKNYHSEGNVWVHTLMALNLAETGIGLATLYGLLFHDTGKAKSLKKIRRQGREHTTFHNHQNAGVEISTKILYRLRFSNSETSDILWYVKNHHVPFELRKMRKGKQVGWVLDPRFENLLKIYRADSLASIPTDKRGRKLKPSLETYNFSRKVWRRTKKKKVLQKKIVTGNDVMKVLKIKPGPEVGKMLKKVQEKQYEGKIRTKQEALKFLKKFK